MNNIKACIKCGHKCKPEKICKQCGGDPMTEKDTMCVNCDSDYYCDICGLGTLYCRRAVEASQSIDLKNRRFCTGRERK